MSYDPYDPPHPQSPLPPRSPLSPQSPLFPPSQVTYPWQPPPRQPPRGMPQTPREPLGRHSDLRVLRRAYRWQRRTATLTALGYFTLFLVLSAFAPHVMTVTVADHIPAGLLLALIQLPVTWLAIALYEHTARRHVDPLADRIRKEAEVNARRGAGR
ncbi:DUF485 domain-containing protein [Streptomyces sp. NBC_00820]|uniref:DUF485 domain-containing protein n=1 Tax=Streptomyces sp. NBC_00820 TaxID=2975842 RepID=UPI002ED17F72|nr:DUF485 domain-containing protein [Streptomyces sp. NBC_00820]